MTKMAPSKRNLKKSAENGPVTRSKKKVDDNIEMTTYTTLNKNSERPITVVSRGSLKSDPKHYEELENRFERIETTRKLKLQRNNNETEKHGIKTESFPISPEIWDQRNTIFLVTHFNVFLYATCFFIQVGTLPVS